MKRTHLAWTLRFVVVFSLWFVVVGVAQTISTVAGTCAITGYGGDGGAATATQLHYSSDIAFDSAGNLYIADAYNHRIRKVDTITGIITTVAGNGTMGYSGDGGAAINAQLNRPRDITFDSAGNLYIVDTRNHRVRKVDVITGVISTVVGNGRRSGYDVGDGGAATDAYLQVPFFITFDQNGNLYIADTYNHRIRKVDTNGIISTVAGNGRGGYSHDGGAATDTQLRHPREIVFDSAGNLYIADQFNGRILKVGVNGIASTVVGRGYSGGLASMRLDRPSGLAFDNSGHLYISDSGNDRILKLDTNGAISTVAGNGIEGYNGDGAATTAQLNFPYGLTFDSSGNLYFADLANHCIRKVTGLASHSNSGGSAINPNPDMQIRNGSTLDAESITSGSIEPLRYGTFKRNQTVVLDFLVRNPGAQVLEIGELSLPSFLSVVSEPLPETLASFDSALLSLAVDTSTAGQFTGEISLTSNDPDAFENPFHVDVVITVSNEPANALNILPGIDLGNITTTTEQDDVVLLSFQLVVPEGSVPVTLDSLTLAASNAGIQRVTNMRLYIDGGTRGQLDPRDVFVGSTDDTEALTFSFPARTFQPNLPMWFIVVGDF
ncbi:MAG: hypothetical protein AAF267_15175 [Deinococcota bacterium]